MVLPSTLPRSHSLPQLVQIRLPALEMEQSPFLPPPTVELVALSLVALLSRMLLLGLSSHPRLNRQLMLLFLVGFLALVLLLLQRAQGLVMMLIQLPRVTLASEFAAMCPWVPLVAKPQLVLLMLILVLTLL